MGAPRQIAVPKRREIYVVRFGPAEGSEIKKTRPPLVIQNDTGNRFSRTTIVAPISSKFDRAKLYPFEALVASGTDTGLSPDSVVLLDQIRTVGKHRLGKRLGVVSNATMAKVDHALLISLGLIPLD